MRVVVDRVAIVALPVVSLGALLVLGGSLDPCLSPGPSCGVHTGISPWLIMTQAMVLWVVAAIDIARTRHNRLVFGQPQPIGAAHRGSSFTGFKVVAGG